MAMLTNYGYTHYACLARACLSRARCRSWAAVAWVCPVASEGWGWGQGLEPLSAPMVAALTMAMLTISAPGDTIEPPVIGPYPRPTLTLVKGQRAWRHHRAARDGPTQWPTVRFLGSDHRGRPGELVRQRLEGTSHTLNSNRVEP
eukprot:scaffold91675_cov36-Phaeocystis_antarctica.AAC.1